MKLEGTVSGDGASTRPCCGATKIADDSVLRLRQLSSRLLAVSVVCRGGDPHLQFYRSFLSKREIFTNDGPTAKMAEITDFGPRKTFFILAIVFGCFTVLWPKILQPMFTGFVTPHHSDSSGKTLQGSTLKTVDVRKIAGGAALSWKCYLYLSTCINNLYFHAIELNR